MISGHADLRIGDSTFGKGIVDVARLAASGAGTAGSRSRPTQVDMVHFSMTSSATARAREPIEVPISRAVLDQDVLALDVTEVTQPLAEGLGEVGIRLEIGRQVTDSSDLRLRVGRYCAAEAGDCQREMKADLSWIMSRFAFRTSSPVDLAVGSVPSARSLTLCLSRDAQRAGGSKRFLDRLT